MTEIRDNLVVSITKQSGQKQLVEYPTNGTEYASFARELRAVNGTSGKEPWPDLYKGFKSIYFQGPDHPNKQCRPISIFLPPGEKLVTDNDCNSKIVPLTPADNAALGKQQRLESSPEFLKKKKEEDAWLLTQIR